MRECAAGHRQHFLMYATPLIYSIIATENSGELTPGTEYITRTLIPIHDASHYTVYMDTLQEYLETVPNEDHRESLQHLIEWVANTFPDLNLEIKWNQPMMLHNGTFIIGFSAATKYVSIAPETPILHEFLERIKASGYGQTKMKFQVQWNEKIDYDLLRDMIERSIEFKKGSTTFWA